MDLGARLAADLSPGATVLLEGGLGAGKTVFVRGVARALGVDPAEVRSPTFALIHIYHGRFPVYHVDLFRIDNVHDLAEVGLEEVIGTDGVALVEWGERLGPYHPGPVVRVRILDRGENRRELILEDQRKPGSGSGGEPAYDSVR
jgi:tRNA threonylcarbamoyladenosine biosynthesis protein TsaE